MPEVRTLRLVLPQWRGAAGPEAGAMAVGAQILHLLLPQRQSELMRVPVLPPPVKEEPRQAPNGILDEAALTKTARDALKLIRISAPQRILTLGGDGASSLPSFEYLASLYGDDLCLIWLSASPALNCRGEGDLALEQMALSFLLKGNAAGAKTAEGCFRPQQVLTVGVRSAEDAERVRACGLAVLSAADLEPGLEALAAWLKSQPAVKAALHFDLQDPGLNLDKCRQVIELTASLKEVVGLSLVRLQPTALANLARRLSALPLAGES